MNKDDLNKYEFVICELKTLKGELMDLKSRVKNIEKMVELETVDHVKEAKQLIDSYLKLKWITPEEYDDYLAHAITQKLSIKGMMKYADGKTLGLPSERYGKNGDGQYIRQRRAGHE